MTFAKNPFAILGLPFSFTDDELRRAYRKMAKETHPDLPHGDEGKFRDVSWAFETLSDQVERAKAAAHFNPTSSSFSRSRVSTVFEEFLSEVKKDSRAAPTPPPEEGVVTKRGSATLTLTLEQAFHGGNFTIEKSGGFCDVCSGRGSVRTKSLHACSHCSGLGYTRKTSGFFSINNVCSSCDGTGTSHISRCRACGGAGSSDGYSFEVSVPKGVRDGFHFNPPEASWLTVYVSIKAHDRFKRDVEALSIDLDLEIWEASFGCKKTVAGIDGRDIEIIVPAGTHDGGIIFVPGAGMSSYPSRGDLTVNVRINVPDANGPYKKQLLEMQAIYTQLNKF